LITQNDITNGFVYNQSTLDFSWIEYNGFTQGTNYPNCTTQLANLSTDNFIFTSLKYYPNPVKNSLSISNQSIINEVAVTSILGQKIMSQPVNDLQTELDFSGLTNGVYFVKVLSEGQSKTIRIVKE
jgi:Secretion system C-terminal sorting domain